MTPEHIKDRLKLQIAVNALLELRTETQSGSLEMCTIDAALGTAQVVSDAVLAADGGDLQRTAATPSITIGGTPALGKMVHFKVSRNVSGTDDMVEDAWLFGCWIQFGLLDAAVAEW